MNYNKNAQLHRFIQQTLKEDIGKGDITSKLVIPTDKSVEAVLLAKEDLVVCGLDIARLIFKMKDKKVQFKSQVKDGQYVKQGCRLAKIQGMAQAILGAERVSLNLLSLLCAIATKTRDYVKRVKPYGVKIMDTRKTLPGLRNLEKYAVRVGGGFNHRFRLDEMVLIKDNHLKTMNPKSQILNAKQTQNLINKIRKKIPKEIKIEIEVKNLREFQAALKLRPQIIMLDNMSIKDMKRAVKIRNHLLSTTLNPLPQLEASGRIKLSNARNIAATGVEMLSVGELTHSIKSVDISLEIL